MSVETGLEHLGGGFRADGRDGAAPIRLSITVLGGALALAATGVFGGVGGPVAGLGLAVVGLFGLWVLVAFERAATGLLLVSMLIPNGVALYFGAGIPLVTFQRAMLVLLVGGALLHAPGRYVRSLWSTRESRLLVGMTGLLALSTIMSVSPAASAREFLSERALGLPFFFAAVWMAVPDRQSARRLLVGLGAVGVVVLALAVVEGFTGRGIVASLELLPLEKLKAMGYSQELERRAGFPRVQSVFQHPLQLGAFLVAYVPLAVMLRRHASGLLGRLWWTIASLVALTALVFTWSRGAWLMLLLALLLLRGGSWRRWLLILAGGVAFLVVWSRLGFLTLEALTYRWWLVNSVLSAMWTRFGLGIGPATFSQAFTVRVTGTGEETGVDPLAYSLTMAIEAGPLFVALFWWLVTGVLRAARSARDRLRGEGRLDTMDVLDALRAGLLANLLLSAFSTSLFGMTVGYFLALALLVVALRFGEPNGGA